MKKFKRTMALFLVLFFAVTGAFAKATPVEGLHEYVLDNGLTLFVAENHSVPLTYIEIAVRTGAVEQTPENAGLFHLYEHMMFKGNELYPNAASIQNALSEMGVANWNGTTGKDYVNYFITVPSSQTEKGLAFWNAAVRTPLMDPQEFENEKKVVISEITGYEVNPGNIYQGYIANTLFPESVYRTDPAGTRTTIQNATVAQLRDIQRRFYIPSNAALFVGGDVDPEKTFQLVKAIYGTWSNNGNSPTKPHDEPTKTPLAKTKLAVMPFDQMSPYMAQVSVTFRGPDTDFDIEDTYAADYLCSLFDEPDGIFKTKIVQDVELGVPQSDMVAAGYPTVRASGTFTFNAIMLQPETSLPERSLKFLKDIQEEIIPQMAADKSLYQKAKVKQIVSIMEKDRISSTDTATDLLSLLRFWWASTSSDYYFSYYKKLGAVTQKSVQDFFAKYITGKNALVTILVNPQVYAQTVAEYNKLGFEVIDSNNAYWWKNPKFAPDSKKVASLTDTSSPEKTPVYKPAENAAGTSSSQKENVTQLKLKNGIPVYVLTDKSKKIDAVSVCVKGGLSHLTRETSGLEGALFHMMSQSSEGYSFEARQKLNFETGASISHYTDPEYTTLSLSVLDSNLYKTLPVMIDGLLNPKFDENLFANNMTSYRQDIQNTLNDPMSLIMYTARNAVYQGHPYQTSPGITPDSIENISIDAMKKLHSSIMQPEDIFVVAVGNVNAKKLVTELNKTLGKLESKKGDEKKAAAEPADLTISGQPQVLTSRNVAGNGYALRIFPSPSVTSDDFVPARIASSIYSEIMFNVVRERRGICYTPLSSVNSTKAAFGFEVLVNLTDYANFAKAVAEARDIMTQGKVIKSLDAKGNYVFDSLADSLDSYRNKFINSNFSSLASSFGKASQLTSDLVYFGDLSHTAKEMDKLKALTADDVLRTFKTYWVDKGSRWFAIVGPGDENKLKFN